MCGKYTKRLRMLDVGCRVPRPHQDLKRRWDRVKFDIRLFLRRSLDWFSDVNSAKGFHHGHLGDFA